MTMDLSAGTPAPLPDDPGVNGTQVAGEEGDIAVEAPPLVGDYMERTFIGLAAEKPQSFGGALNAPMITAMINQCLHDKTRAQNDAAERQAQINELSAELSSLRTQLAIARSEMASSVKTNRIQKVCAFLSPICLSFGVDLFKANLNLSLLAFAIGVVLLAINFIPGRGAEQ